MSNLSPITKNNPKANCKNVKKKQNKNISIYEMNPSSNLAVISHH